MFPTILTRDKDITLYSSFRTPAKAKYYFEVRENSDISELIKLYRFANDNNLPLVFLGSGTNMLFAFDVFDGIIVRNLLKGITFDDDVIHVRSGELVTPLSLKLAKENENSLYGKWIGLPGTVGGAVAGNAGCFGFEAKDSVIQWTVVDLDTGDEFILRNEDFHFAYRHSILRSKLNWFLKDTTLKRNLIATDTTDPRTFRSSKQPGWFTCGSFFKNPVWDSAGRLIDQAGLKGMKIGGASISDIHANFFVHDGHGSYQDILALRDIAKKKIKELYDVELQEEVRIIWDRS